MKKFVDAFLKMWLLFPSISIKRCKTRTKHYVYNLCQPKNCSNNLPKVSNRPKVFISLGKVIDHLKSLGMAHRYTIWPSS